MHILFIFNDNISVPIPIAIFQISEIDFGLIPLLVEWCNPLIMILAIHIVSMFQIRS